MNPTNDFATRVWTILFGILLGLLGAGLVWIASRPPRGEPILLSAPPNPAPWVVHVEGAVSRPGVYELSAGSRVRDAIDLAGGFLPQADGGKLNLAAFLEDGGRILVPEKQEQAAASSMLAGQSPGQRENLPVELININTADAARLEELPGIGPVTAQKIIDYRNTEGAFAAIADIQEVSGIGPVTFERIKNMITVTD